MWYNLDNLIGVLIMIIKQGSIGGFVAQKDKVFLVPEFQRPYSWEIENADDFLYDLENCVQNPKKVHFFGTIFYNPSPDDERSYMIIDGQQRITTTMLMITAIARIIKDRSEDNSAANYPKEKYDAETIEKKYLLSSAYAKIKLRAVAYDSRIFQDIFDTDGINLSPEEKRSNLWKVYRHFKKHFAKKGELYRYLDALKNFSVLSLGLGGENDDNPQRVFESINSTGKELEAGDKIRNFALMLDSKALSDKVYKNYWSKIENALTDPDSDDISDFFRNYLIAKRQAVIPTNDVYSEFKKLFKEEVGADQSEKIDGFYSEIVKYLNYYCVMALGTPGFEKTRVPEVAYRMRYIRIGLYMPFAMSVLSYYESGKLSVSEVDEIFSIIETYFSRRLICNISASSLDKVFATLHKNVVDILDVEENAKYTEVLKFLMLRRTGQTRLPDDKEVSHAALENDFYRQKISNVMYVLTLVNDSERKKEANYFKDVVEGRIKLSVEHIMPQTIDPKDKNNGAKWVQMLGKDWQETYANYLHTLGNLTLTGYNTEYSNRPYLDEKHPERSKMWLIDRKGSKVGLGYSDLALNKYIARTYKTRWAEKEIKRRAKWFTNAFSKLWPYPSSSFVPTKSDSSVSLLSGQVFTNCQISTVTVFGESIAVGSWAEALDYIAETLYESSPETFLKALDDDYLSTVIVKSRTAERGLTQILDTKYWVRIDNSTNAKIRITTALAKLYHLSPEDIRAEVSGGEMSEAGNKK